MSGECDMCGTAIEDGKCSCGEWLASGDMDHHPFRTSLEEFHKLRKMTLTNEAPHLGCCSFFFRGDYNDCVAVTEFLLSRKKRPYYEN